MIILEKLLLLYTQLNMVGMEAKFEYLKTSLTLFDLQLIFLSYAVYQLRMELQQSQHSVTLLPSYYLFQIFSLNLSKPMSRGGINWSLCGSNSLGTSHSTQGRDDSSSSSTAGLHCIYCILVYIGVMSVRTPREIF